jgi:hypothetical protein
MVNVHLLQILNLISMLVLLLQHLMINIYTSASYWPSQMQPISLCRRTTPQKLNDEKEVNKFIYLIWVYCLCFFCLFHCVVDIWSCFCHFFCQTKIFGLQVGFQSETVCVLRFKKLLKRKIGFIRIKHMHAG